jgi:release factor glutamine methyltransferase
MNIANARILGAKVLCQHSQSPALDSDILLSSALRKQRTFLYSHDDNSLTEKQKERFLSLLKRRKKGEPVSLLTGHREFARMDFLVTKDVLTPRPETELLFEQALQRIHTLSQKTRGNGIIVVDVGTGSGCIILAIAKHFEKRKPSVLECYAIDRSPKAIKIAKKNAIRLKMQVHIRWMLGHLIAPLFTPSFYQKLRKNHLIITANLPYLSQERYASAPVEVRKFEPKIALYGGNDGLDVYRKLIQRLHTLLSHSSPLSLSLFCEIDPSQKRPMERILRSINHWGKVQSQYDLSNRARLVTYFL